MAKIVKIVTPFAYEAFERHALFGRQFSSLEIQAIRDRLASSRMARASAANFAPRFLPKRTMLSPVRSHFRKPEAISANVN